MNIKALCQRKSMMQYWHMNLRLKTIRIIKLHKLEKGEN